MLPFSARGKFLQGGNFKVLGGIVRGPGRSECWNIDLLADVAQVISLYIAGPKCQHCNDVKSCVAHQGDDMHA